MTKKQRAVVEEIAVAINKKHERGEEVKIPAVQTVLYTKRKKAEFYVNCTTSERSFNLDDVIDTNRRYRLIRRESKIMDGFCFVYDEELDLLAVITASIDTHILSEGETTYWQETGRFYIDRNKNLYSTGKDITSEFKCYGVRFPSTHVVLHMFKKIGEDHCICPDPSYDKARYLVPDFSPVYKLFPRIVSGEGEAKYNLNTKVNLIHFFQMKSIGPSKLEGQKKVDILIQHKIRDKAEYVCYAEEELKKILETDISVYPYMIPTEYYKSGHFSVIEKVKCDEPMACLREFELDIIDGSLHEVGRVYYTGREAVKCKSDNQGSFAYMHYSDDSFYWKSVRILNHDFDALKGTIADYFADQMDTFPDKLKGYFLFALTYNSVFESLYKAGYSDYLGFLLSFKENGLPLRLKTSCGLLREDCKSVYAMLGLNKYQTDVLLNKTAEMSDIDLVFKVKCILRGEHYLGCEGNPCGKWSYETVSISDIDDETFDSVVGMIDEIYRIKKEYADLVVKKWELPSTKCIDRSISFIVDNAAMISAVWGRKVLIKAIPSLMMLYRYALGQHDVIHHLMDSEGETSESADAYAMMYRDYIDMVRRMDSKQNNKPYADSVDDIERMHNNVVRIFRIKEDENEKKIIAEASKRVEKFCYENSDYLVIVPMCPEDYLKEGQFLSHCVGIYIDRVSDGETNIMFIRKKSAPDKPFFTVEISDGGRIDQIHGFANRNLSTEPDLIPFVEEWKNKYGLQLDTINKVR